MDVFRPERWLVDESKDEEKEKQRLKDMGSCMLQFGAGSRTCIGKNISLLEIYKVVPSLLRSFEVCLFYTFLSSGPFADRQKKDPTRGSS